MRIIFLRPLIFLVISLVFVFSQGLVYAQISTSQTGENASDTPQMLPIKNFITQREETGGLMPVFEGYTNRPFSAMMFVVNGGLFTDTSLAGGDGRWRWTPTRPLKPGEYQIAIYAIDSADSKSRTLDYRTFRINSPSIPMALFDISLHITHSKDFVKAGESFPITVNFVNFGGNQSKISAVDGTIVVKLFSPSGLEMLRQEEKIEISERQQEIERFLQVPSDASAGNYTAFVQLLYGEKQEATASASVNIRSNGIASLEKIDGIGVLFVLAIIFLLLLVVIHFLLPAVSRQTALGLWMQRVFSWGVVSFALGALLFNGVVFVSGYHELASAETDYKDVRIFLSVPPYYTETNEKKDLITELKLYNFDSKKQDVLLQYQIVDAKNKPMYTASETVAVQTQASFTKYFDVPEKTPKGRYFISVAISDLARKPLGNASSAFLVSAPEGDETSDTLSAFATGILYVLIALCLILIADLTLYIFWLHRTLKPRYS